jgi:hypothetical protein
VSRDRGVSFDDASDRQSSGQGRSECCAVSGIAGAHQGCGGFAVREEAVDRVSMAVQDGAVHVGDEPALTQHAEDRRGAVPDHPGILHATGLLNRGESESLELTAPTEPGEYPFVCTFPGHGTLMRGVMEVVE